MVKPQPQLALPLAAPAPIDSRASSHLRDVRAAHEMHRHHHLIAYASPARA